MSRIPPVGQFMTRSPLVIPSTLTLREAAKIMQRERVRHLPVERAGKIVGILSDRDVKAARHDEFLAEAMMTADPYMVRESIPLNEAVGVMARCRYGSVLVTDDQQRLVGILTATDALSLFEALIVEHFANDSLPTGVSKLNRPEEVR